MNDLASILRHQMQVKVESKPALDAAKVEKDEANPEAKLSFGEQFISTSIARDALYVLKDWADMSEGDLDDGETFAERLDALLVDMADEDGDKKITDSEEMTINAAKDAINAYLEYLGADEGDIQALLDEQDEDAAETLRELVSGDDSDIDDLLLGEDDEDDEVMDAVAPAPVRQGKTSRNTSGVVRKAFVSFHHGVRIKRWKRVAGRPKKPSAAQKAQRIKALAKTKTSNAMRRWKKSMTNRKKAGVKPNTVA